MVAAVFFGFICFAIYRAPPTSTGIRSDDDARVASAFLMIMSFLWPVALPIAIFALFFWALGKLLRKLAEHERY